MRDKKFFLPCMSHDLREVVAKRADLSQLFIEAMVAEKTRVSPGIWNVRLDVAETVKWRPGQYVDLRTPAGDVRSYSIASVCEEDYFLELHIREYPDGKLSAWIARELGVGDAVAVRGPLGTCTYDDSDPARPLLLIATGTGAAPLIGVARDALIKGHRGPIFFYHGAATDDGLYLGEQLAELEGKHPNFFARSAASREGERLRIVDLALEEQADLTGFLVYLAGNPDAVEAARVKALALGAPLDGIHADPFESPEPYQPRDHQKLDQIAADPELWAVLGHGAKLQAILSDFYTQVYADPELSPFFHRVTKTRAIEKQYEFLVDIFTGTRKFFGHQPFNAHHWMVISDELFDYREKLFFDVVRKHDVAERFITKWSSIHEMFRREIVKTAPRGIYHDGTEIELEGYSVETADVAMMCDGCLGEIESGSRARLHRRTGELFCMACEGSSVAA